MSVLRGILFLAILALVILAGQAHATVTLQELLVGPGGPGGTDYGGGAAGATLTATSAVSGSTQIYTAVVSFDQWHGMVTPFLCPTTNTETSCQVYNGGDYFPIADATGNTTLSPGALVAGTVYLLYFDSVNWRMV